MHDAFFQPVSGIDLPRFAGVPTFMRLPHLTPELPRYDDVQIGIVGVPWDGGTTNRPGPRHGPRQLRDASTMIRYMNPANGIAPFAAVNCADLGDVPPNPVSIEDNLTRITNFFSNMRDHGIVPLAAGGDHLISLPILRALAKDGPLGLIQFDSHTDLFDSYFGGQRYTHGTPFRRAVEEGIVDPKRFVQIGIRGTAYSSEDVDWGEAQGIRIIRIEEFFDRGIGDVMDEVREIMGDRRTYCTYDIDFVDPTFAPGTGTPEVGGPSSFQSLQVIREMRGLNVIGADLVEVSPPFDQGAGTAWLGVSLMFELLCILSDNIRGR